MITNKFTLIAIPALFFLGCSSSKKSASANNCQVNDSSRTIVAAVNQFYPSVLPATEINVGNQDSVFVGTQTDDYGISTNLSYEINGKYSHPVKKEILDKALMLRDIIPFYPVNWIEDYDSVLLLTTTNGKTIETQSENELLSIEQISALKAVDLGSDVVINIYYKSENSITKLIYNNEINLKMTLVPDIEAAFKADEGNINAEKALKKYLAENAIKQISNSTSKEFQKGKVNFTVNEKGEIINVQLTTKSGDSKTDKLLLKVINKMPNWKPAEDSNGRKVSQDFIFSLGINGC